MQPCITCCHHFRGTLSWPPNMLQCKKKMGGKNVICFVPGWIILNASIFLVCGEDILVGLNSWPILLDYLDWVGMVWYGMVWYGMVWYGWDKKDHGRNIRNSVQIPSNIFHYFLFTWIPILSTQIVIPEIESKAAGIHIYEKRVRIPYSCACYAKIVLKITNLELQPHIL